MDNLYHLEGQVSIPDERKAEFNKNVLDILRACGIRKLKKVEIAGKCIIVIREPEENEEGIVAFDYSIFENQRRQISFYDMNSCKLHIAEQGYNEFGMAINLIMTMQEAYSAEQCYLMRKDQICDVYGYALLIERTIGIKLSFPNRENIWDMLLFFKSSPAHKAITYKEIWDKFPLGYGQINLEQFIGCLLSDDSSAHRPEKRFEGGKSDLKYANIMQRVYYAYELLCRLSVEKGDGEISCFLKTLLEENLAEREKLAEQEDDFGLLAEISLYELPVCIVVAFAWAIGEEFWTTWFSLEVSGYKEIYTQTEKKPDEAEAKEEGARILYKAFRRSNEDEFLEFWDEKELYLSEDMRECLKEWKETYAEIDIEEAEAIQAEEYLADILLEMADIWSCRYMEDKTVRECVEHGNELSYKKALLMLRKMLDRIIWHFPELTAGQVKEWILPRWIDRWERTRISAYGSLLGNHKKRLEILGF